MCTGNCNDLTTLPSVAASVVNGTDGQNAYLYAVSADDNTGLNFTYPADPTQEYRAFKNTTTPISTPLASDFAGLWFKAIAVDGTDGTDGVSMGFLYNWLGSAFSGDPGPGNVCLNAVNAGTATVLSISANVIGGPNIDNFISSIVASTSTIKGYIQINLVSDPTKFLIFAITASTLTTYFSLTVTYLSSSTVTPFSTNDDVQVVFIRTGDKGNTGSTGSVGSNGTNGTGYTATSTSSVALGIGAKSFTTQAGLAYTVGARVRTSDPSNPSTKYMEGVLTGYSGTTLAFTSDNVVGSGTLSSWNINLAGDKGTTGSTGATGSGTLQTGSYGNVYSMGIEGTTVGATTTSLSLFTGSPLSVLTLPSQTVWYCQLYLSAINDNVSPDSAAWQVTFLAKNNSGTVTMPGAETYLVDAATSTNTVSKRFSEGVLIGSNAVTGTPTLAYSIVGQTVFITVTGIAGATIFYTGKIDIQEVSIS